MRSLGNEIVRSYEGRISGIAQIKSDTSAMLKGFDRAHAAMSKELKADLAKVRPALMKEERKRRSEARQFMGELARVVAEGKAATQARLKELANVQAGAHDEWKKLGATMHARRTGKAPKAAPPPQGEG
jgi:hypothetical protein